jgi:hypothetical protein
MLLDVAGGDRVTGRRAWANDQPSVTQGDGMICME